MSCFPEPHTRSQNIIEVKLDLPKSATKFNLRNATGVDTSDFAQKLI